MHTRRKALASEALGVQLHEALQDTAGVVVLEGTREAGDPALHQPYSQARATLQTVINSGVPPFSPQHTVNFWHSLVV